MPDIPANAKKPADRKAKAEAKDEPFKIHYEKDDKSLDVEIDREVGNDYEIMEWLADGEDNPAMIAKVMRALLGREQHDKMKNFFRDEQTGRVDPDGVMEFFNTVWEELGNQQASSGS